MSSYPRDRRRHGATTVLALWLVLGSGACSIKRMAVNMSGNSVAEGGATFTSDDDPELVEAALPFSLKLMESLLAESPEHRALLTSLASGFARFAYAFVQMRGDEVEPRDLDRAIAHWERARRLFERARDYGLRGLDTGHAGLSAALRADPVEAMPVTGPADVPLLYWTAVS